MLCCQGAAEEGWRASRDEGLMARSDHPFPLENLVPGYRGGQFAMIAVRGRRCGVTELERQVAMADRYTAAAMARYRLYRRQEEEEAASSRPPPQQ